MELLSSFGVDYKLLGIQIVNFFILFACLTYLLYKPLLKILEDRERQAKENILLSDALKEQKSEFLKAKDEMLKSAQEEVRKILIDTRALGEKEHLKIIKAAEERASQIIKHAEESAILEKDNIVKEVKKEITDLVILATQKFVVKKLDSENDKVLIEKIIEEVKTKL